MHVCERIQMKNGAEGAGEKARQENGEHMKVNKHPTHKHTHTTHKNDEKWKQNEIKRRKEKINIKDTSCKRHREHRRCCCWWWLCCYTEIFIGRKRASQPKANHLKMVYLSVVRTVNRSKKKRRNERPYRSTWATMMTRSLTRVRFFHFHLIDAIHGTHYVSIVGIFVRAFVCVCQMRNIKTLYYIQKTLI